MTRADPGLPHLDLGGYVLGGLTEPEREAFERHLASCPDCRRELAELRAMPGLLDESADPVDVPAHLESRVMAAIAREPEMGAVRPLLPRPPRRRRWTQAWPLAAAAALAIAFVAGLGAGRGLPGTQQPPPVPAAQTIRLVAAGGGGGSGVATVRHETAGSVIELSVRDLPPPPPGHFYTCWLVAADDTPQHQDRVSVGSFTTTGAGDATVRWQTAADLARYPSLGVTLEPDNGNPLHQGPKVLAAA